MRRLSIDSAHPPAPWLAELARCAIQEPLVDTRLSLGAFQRVRRSTAPRTVFLGIGLCARDALSKAVPLDLLGVLLPAEAARRALDADELLVLIADRHALENGFAPEQVERRAREVEAVLGRLRRLGGLEALSILRASRLHREPGYRAALARAQGVLGASRPGYLLRQVADAVYLDRERAPLLKVGWALRGADPTRRFDEPMFDRALREVAGDRIGFLYCKPGRSLADESPRMPPYVVKRPEARVCFGLAEDPAAKLRRAQAQASGQTVAACRRHLRRVVYTYGRMVEPLPRGPLDAKLAALVRRLTPGADQM